MEEPKDPKDPKDAVPSSEALCEAAGKLLEKVNAAKAARAKVQAAVAEPSEPLLEAECAEEAGQVPVQEASSSSDKASREDVPKEAQESEKAEEDPAVKATAGRWKP